MTGRALGVLDSRFLGRVGRMRILLEIIVLGFALVVLSGAVASGIVEIAGWITFVCFGIWALLTLALVISWMGRREPSTVASPFARALVARDAPGGTSALLSALIAAEARGREFIAEAALLSPVNNQKAASEFVQAFLSFEAEIAWLVRSAEQFDHRWELLWTEKPGRSEDRELQGPFTLGRLKVVGGYIAQRTKQLSWMIDFLQTGDDEHVRHIESWVKHKQREVGRSPAEASDASP